MIIYPHATAEGDLTLMNAESSFSPKLEFIIGQNGKDTERFSEHLIHDDSLLNGHASDREKANHILLGPSKDDGAGENFPDCSVPPSSDINSSIASLVDNLASHHLHSAGSHNYENDSGLEHHDVSPLCLMQNSEEILKLASCNNDVTPQLSKPNVCINNDSNWTGDSSAFNPSNFLSNSSEMISVNGPVTGIGNEDTFLACSNADLDLHKSVGSMPLNFERSPTRLPESVNTYLTEINENMAKSLNQLAEEAVISECDRTLPEGITSKVDDSSLNFNSIEFFTNPNLIEDDSQKTSDLPESVNSYQKEIIENMTTQKQSTKISVISKCDKIFSEGTISKADNSSQNLNSIERLTCLKSDLVQADVMQKASNSNDKLNSISNGSSDLKEENNHTLIEISNIPIKDNWEDKDSVSIDFMSAERNAKDPIASRKSSPEGCVEGGINSQVIDIQDYANLKVELSHYKSENEQLQHRLSNLESELDSFKTQQPQLLSTIEQQEKQLKQINETARRQQDIDARSYAAFKQELESQNKALKHECETMKHEREVSVMRYAKSEMDVIQLRKEVETCQKKLQDAIKERDHAQTTAKQLISDKNKFSQMYDNKCSEVRVAHNEIDQLKSELNAKNHKLKYTLNKLKEESDNHKETQNKLDTVSGTIQAAKNEAEQAKVDAQASIKAFQESQENRAFVLDQQLKEEQAKLILLRADKEDLEKKLQQLSSKLQQVEAEAKTLNEKNCSLTCQLQCTEKEKLELDVKLNTMQQLMNKEVQANVELESQLVEMQKLRLELEQELKKSEALEAEAMILRTSNAELLIDMDSCQKREAETLDFTQRLTAQNAKLQSDFSALQAKNEELEIEQRRVDSLKAELDREKTQRLEENKILARHVAEHSQRCEELSKQLAEQKSENVVLRRKNAATIRELTRELQQAKKLFAEHNSDGGGSGSNSLCQDSRTSSCASLTDTSQAPSSAPSSIHVEPDKQTLIERIVELQRRNAQYLERVEFLEEHNQEMTEELKKKTKIVQNFMLREPVGALSSNSMDSNKLFLRQPLQFSKEMSLSKKGYMASLYSSKIKDKNMTLEKSLEICQTLHSLLEDTILKNITLKENMDTLGEEIARLRNERAKEGGS